MQGFYKIFKFLIPTLITALILFILFSKVNYKEIKEVFVSSNKIAILIPAMLIFLTPLISALRWKKLMALLDHNIGYSTVLKTFLSNVPIAKISPSNMGDFVRSLYLKKEVPISKNIGIIFLENLFDIAILAIFALIGGVILKIKIATATGSAVILAIAVVFILMPILVPRIKSIMGNKWEERLVNFHRAFGILLKKPGSFFWISFYTFSAWLIVLICFKTMFYSFGLNIPFLYIIAAQPIAIFFGLLPITFSGIGVRESLMVYLYYSLAPISSIIAVGLIYSFLVAILLPISCLPFLFMGINKIKNLSVAYGNQQ